VCLCGLLNLLCKRTSQPLRVNSSGNQFLHAPLVKRHDEEQINFSKRVVHRANGGDYGAGCLAVSFLQYRKPEIQMFIVAACDELGFREIENWPRPDLVTHFVAALGVEVHDLGGCGCVEAAESC
jgi:hypothetical protein